MISLICGILKIPSKGATNTSKGSITGELVCEDGGKGSMEGTFGTLTEGSGHFSSVCSVGMMYV